MAHQIGIVTTSRADYGIYRPILNALRNAGDVQPLLWVGGMHLDPQFGLTARSIEHDGYPIADRIDSLLAGDSEESVAISMAITMLRFAESLARTRPDILVLLGDRFEMHAAACAAVPLRIPMAHIHGGEETANAIDNVFRHSLTKLCQVHFVATEKARLRLLAMGEAPELVVHSGAPSLDNIDRITPLSREDMAERFGMPRDPFLLVTYHPETLAPREALADLGVLWKALQQSGLKLVFTQSNADTHGRAMNAKIRQFCDASGGRAILVDTLGVDGYFSAMRYAEAMVGNSSSGIIEAASFGLPVVNIGDRQAGRERSDNVIDVPTEECAIAEGLELALSADFRARAASARNIWGDGGAAPRIVEGLKRFLADGAPLAKRFHDPLELQAGPPFGNSEAQ